MLSGNGGESLPVSEYVCQVHGCFVRYTSAHGHFVAPDNGSGLEEEILPRVRRPHDGAPMYLGEVRPRERNFRLWRCPRCKATSRSGTSPAENKISGLKRDFFAWSSLSLKTRAFRAPQRISPLAIADSKPPGHENEFR